MFKFNCSAVFVLQWIPFESDGHNGLLIMECTALEVFWKVHNITFGHERYRILFTFTRLIIIGKLLNWSHYYLNTSAMSLQFLVKGFSCSFSFRTNRQKAKFFQCHKWHQNFWEKALQIQLEYGLQLEKDVNMLNASGLWSYWWRLH